MTSINEVYTEFFSQCVTPVRSFSRDESVHAGGCDAGHLGACSTGDYADAFRKFGATCTKVDWGTKCGG